MKQKIRPATIAFRDGIEKKHLDPNKKSPRESNFWYVWNKIKNTNYDSSSEALQICMDIIAFQNIFGYSVECKETEILWNVFSKKFPVVYKIAQKELEQNLL